MSKPPIPVLLLILSLSVCFLPVYGQEGTASASRCSQAVYFRFDKTDIDSTYADNQRALHVLHTLFTDSFQVSFIDSILISAFSSPEGREAYNLKLSQQRAATVGQYLTRHYPLLSAVPLVLMPDGENWEGLQALAAADPHLNEREEVLMILAQVHDPAKRESLLKRLNAGKAYEYMQQYILPRLRNAEVSTVRLSSRLRPDVLYATPLRAGLAVKQDTKTPLYIAAPVAASVAAPVAASVAAPTSSPRYAALKTNAAAWAMTTVNLAYEIQVGRHFSIDLPLMWSSWDVAHATALRIILLQPELRYWFCRPGHGHFLGMHVHAARYNLKWNEYRYQDTGYPLLGAGIGYGYAFPLNGRWGMECNIGAGYANSRYDTFRNVPNGSLRHTRRLHYWGITRLGLSLIYKL